MNGCPPNCPSGVTEFRNCPDENSWKVLGKLQLMFETLKKLNQFSVHASMMENPATLEKIR
jgi:hypothetical protein